jgi:DNA-binding NarL/FixJ family response regulator
VLIVDDEPAVRDLLRLALDLEGGFTVVAEAGDGRQGIDLARLHQPDLVLLDLLMPGMGGLEAVDDIARVAPAAKVVVLTAVDRSSLGPDSIAGIAGFFEKTSDLSAVTQALAVLVSASS